MQIQTKLLALQKLTALLMTKLEDVEINFVDVQTGDTIFQVSGNVKTSPVTREAEACLKKLLAGQNS